VQKAAEAGLTTGRSDGMSASVIRLFGKRT
jgi:hypothetical protein